MRVTRDEVRALLGSIDPDALRHTLEALPAPRSRLHWPDAMARTDALILDRFASHGWHAEEQPFELTDQEVAQDFDPLPTGRWRRVVHPRLRGVNVVATLEGTESREAVVVLAHHDTIRDSPGADDNGSGVVALLELARLLPRWPTRRAVILAAVDMEEIGLLGSRELVRRLRGERPVRGAIVFDAIGYRSDEPGSQRFPQGFPLLFPGLYLRLRRRRFRGDFLALVERRASGTVTKRLREAMAIVGGPDLALPVRDPGDRPIVGPLIRRTLPIVRDFARSDHVSFLDAGIAAVQVADTSDFRNPHYHRATDTPDTVDLEQLRQMIAATVLAVRALA